MTGEGAQRTIVRQSCGFVKREWSELLRVSGEDRERFLNGYLTCEVDAESASYGFFTDAKGRILADAVVSPVDDALRVAVPAGRAEAIVEHLRSYVIADRVELEVEDGSMQWLLAGPRAPQVAEQLGLPVGETWSVGRGEVAGHAVDVTVERPLGVPVLVLTVDRSTASEVAEAIAAHGGEPVGFDAIESLRIEAGVPRYGADFDERHFPQETGLDDAVSYTKGCYLGQEVVARIHYRGHVNHSLRAVVLDGRRRVETPSSVSFAGKDVGAIGSTTFVPERGETVSLAILHRDAAEAGTTVVLESGDEARVADPGGEA